MLMSSKLAPQVYSMFFHTHFLWQFHTQIHHFSQCHSPRSPRIFWDSWIEASQIHIYIFCFTVTFRYIEAFQKDSHLTVIMACFIRFQIIILKRGIVSDSISFPVFHNQGGFLPFDFWALVCVVTLLSITFWKKHILSRTHTLAQMELAWFVKKAEVALWDECCQDFKR